MTDNSNNSAAPRRRGRPPANPSRNESIPGTSSEDMIAPVERRPMREEDSRARAAKRAAEIRQHRTEHDFDENDKFRIERDKVPDGWSYEWKRKTVLGKEDPSYEISLRRGGWEPVPASRHPEMMPKGHYDTIEREGMILMERPNELTEDARRKELREARNAVRAKEQQLNESAPGTFEREGKVKRGYQPMDIPKD